MSYVTVFYSTIQFASCLTWFCRQMSLPDVRITVLRTENQDLHGGRGAIQNLNEICLIEFYNSFKL